MPLTRPLTGIRDGNAMNTCILGMLHMDDGRLAKQIFTAYLTYMLTLHVKHGSFE